MSIEDLLTDIKTELGDEHKGLYIYGHPSVYEFAQEIRQYIPDINIHAVKSLKSPSVNVMNYLPIRLHKYKNWSIEYDIAPQK